MRGTTIRRRRAGVALVGAIALTGALSACGDSGSSQTGGGSSTSSTAKTASSTGSTTKGSTPAVAEDSVASQLILGGPSECPTRPLCLKGLEDTYGLKFKEFKALDAGGPITVAALQNDDIQVGLIFTSDGQIAANDWVLLEDDEGLQPAEQVTPIANEALAKEYGDDLKKVVDGVSAKLTTEDLVKLNERVGVDKEDAADVAQDFVDEKELAPETTGAAKTGTPIKVGSADFSESEILANVYAIVLKANGYTVETKFRVGSREVYFPAVKSGADINFIPDYSGSLLNSLDESSPAVNDPKKTFDLLVKALEGTGVVAFTPAEAEDKNGFVVTRKTADTYKLTKLSDLAKPAT